MSVDESLFLNASTIPISNFCVSYMCSSETSAADFRGVRGFKIANGMSVARFNPYQLYQQARPPYYQESFKTRPTTVITGSILSPTITGSLATNGTNKTLWKPYQIHFRSAANRFGSWIPHSQQQEESTIIQPPVNVGFPNALNRLFASEFGRSTAPKPMNFPPIQLLHPITTWDTTLPPVQLSPLTSRCTAVTFKRDQVPSESASGNDDKYDSSLPKSPTLDEMANFARQFKERRIELGLSQEDAGFAVGKFYGKSVNGSTICRFVQLKLTFEYMLKLKPYFSNWLQETYCCDEQQKGKCRTLFGVQATLKLESIFTKNQKPTTEEIMQISQQLKVKNEAVRIWFSNRRKKENRLCNKIQLEKRTTIFGDS